VKVTDAAAALVQLGPDLGRGRLDRTEALSGVGGVSRAAASTGTNNGGRDARRETGTREPGGGRLGLSLGCSRPSRQS